MFDPVATYRIQFHKEFTFKHLEEIIPYLHDLGVKTIYASPIFKAVAGSTHGYDVVDPLQINPEIGTLEQLRAISGKLKKFNMSWLQDIVPNHMAFDPANVWLMDVLENGKDSAYSSYFDIEWDSDLYNGRIMVPFLGLPFEEAVEMKEIQLAIQNKKTWLTYSGQRYPVKLDTVLSPTQIQKINNDPKLLLEIAGRQAYQLCYWQETDWQINYRRFFTVNGLICLNMQNKEVFTAYHELIKQLIDEGLFQGLRVDHIDGLYDPQGYLERLRDLSGAETYITVEKILEKGETFPASWPVQGNTGYDFLAVANNLFTNPKGETIFTRKYQMLTGTQDVFEESILAKKALILKRHMAGELENLYQLFIRLDLVKAEEFHLVKDQLKSAIAKLLIYCPVYRFYGNALPLAGDEAAELETLFNTVREAEPELQAALDLLQAVLLAKPQTGHESYNKRALQFYQRLMQFSGPLMAKGVEDTLMYTYNRFIGHNEVGDAPDSFGLPAAEFHQFMIERQLKWPLTANATSTHDTKRGEDVRMRLNILTDLPEEWFKLVQQWRIGSEKLIDCAPDKNDEYFIYQAVNSAFPMPGANETDFTSRMQEYLLKALREGKQNSNWAEPNAEYEESVKKFISGLLQAGSDFTQQLADFRLRVSDFGIINSLAQVLLKFTCPGVPDLYQGCESWDLSLVDPDNRRPVDYQFRKSLLQPGNTVYNIELWQQLWANRYDGQVKLALTQRLLQLRAADPLVFAKGDYLPLTVTGKYKTNILTFARYFGQSWYLTVIPLQLAAIVADGANPGGFDWADTAISLPESAPRNWRNLLSDVKGYAGTTLSIADVFAGLPVGLIKLSPPPERSSGLLLHITSLPGTFGIGDIGPEARKFIDFLFDSGQRYWQMLPVNPVDKGAGYSPYSANSSLAGNSLLISPELLAESKWLLPDELAAISLPFNRRADFGQAASLKQQLFAQAYSRFLKQGDFLEFQQFKATENYWLDDFSLYQVLKRNNQNKPWYQWENKLKTRNAAAIKHAGDRYADAIDQEKWLQFIFSKQWRSLRAYAVKKGVTLFGDMPFYISYDSVDVWANPELFKLDQAGKITGIAGVPPDYFSAEGQLWGMPVFDWEAHKGDHYKWWLQRIRKNLEYFDLIRLDHFRAFISYWEVPGGEKTAINGKWLPGPGAAFFEAIRDEIGHLPFVAEDLGDIDDAVYRLRDEFKLPGMKVLQFGFGADLPVADHIPHNYKPNSFAYTGTHDNNTLKGWFSQDLDPAGRSAVGRYSGQKVSADNIVDIMTRLCFSSVSNVAILPVQDLLKLDASDRMNIPSLAEGNWAWRLGGDEFNEKVASDLAVLTHFYGR